MSYPRKKLPNNQIVSCLIYASILFYLALCVLNLMSLRPLWLDERLLLNNFKELKPLEIFGPLKYGQGFPRLYLYIIQNISGIFNYNLLALRILPFIFMLMGFAMWLKIFKIEEGKGVNHLLFILSWCGSFFMTYYSAEFKQYSADVFSAAVFTYILLRQKEYLLNSCRTAPLIITYLFLPALLLFSYAAYFLLLLPAYNLLLSIRNNKKNLLYFYIYLFSALTFFYISYNSDIKYTSLAYSLRGYWKDYYISSVSFYDFMKSFWEGLRNIFVRWFWEAPPATHIMSIFAPLALYFVIVCGFRQFKKDKYLIVSLSSLTLVLLIGLFIAGILNIYPFTGARITLFIAPFIFYAIIKGIGLVKAKNFVPYVILLAIFIFTLLSISVYLLHNYCCKLWFL